MGPVSLGGIGDKIVACVRSLPSFDLTSFLPPFFHPFSIRPSPHLLYLSHPLLHGLLQLLTERAGLSKFALELLTSLAPRLNTSFTNHLPRQFIPPLLELIRRTNNIIRERAETCLFKIVETCHLVLLIPYLTGAVKDSSVKLRKAVGSAMWIAVDSWGAGGKVGEVEMVVKVLATDKDVEVRKVAKELWEKYKETWPDRVEE